MNKIKPMFNYFIDTETETKYGICKLDLMIHLMRLLDSKNPDKDFNRFKSYLVSQIKRGISKHEEIKLMEGVLKYVQSEPQTNERMDAMNYLFDLDFLLNNEQEVQVSDTTKMSKE